MAKYFIAALTRKYTNDNSTTQLTNQRARAWQPHRTHTEHEHDTVPFWRSETNICNIEERMN